MKTICDIRLFRSTQPNVDGNSHPASLGNKHLNIIVHRIVMKLREHNFSLGEFDHLYVNFTTCLKPGEIRPANRSIDPYHTWYRYYDIGVTMETYECLDWIQCTNFITSQLQELLTVFFTTENNIPIADCISEAVEKGEQMMILYKTKQTAKLNANIYLQYLNSGKYLPHLFVWNSDHEEVLHEKLAETADLNVIGEIQLSSKKVTIKPRKNSFMQNSSPIVFEL